MNKVVRLPNGNFITRKAKAGPQQAGDCGSDLRWLQHANGRKP